MSIISKPDLLSGHSLNSESASALYVTNTVSGDIRNGLAGEIDPNFSLQAFDEFIERLGQLRYSPKVTVRGYGAYSMTSAPKSHELKDVTEAFLAGIEHTSEELFSKRYWEVEKIFSPIMNALDNYRTLLIQRCTESQAKKILSQELSTAITKTLAQVGQLVGDNEGMKKLLAGRVLAVSVTAKEKGEELFGTRDPEIEEWITSGEPEVLLAFLDRVQNSLGQKPEVVKVMEWRFRDRTKEALEKTA